MRLARTCYRNAGPVLWQQSVSAEERYSKTHLRLSMIACFLNLNTVAACPRNGAETVDAVLLTHGHRD